MRPLTDEPDRSEVLAWVPAGASLLAFGAAAVTVGFQGPIASDTIAVTLGVLVVIAGRIGGRLPAITSAAMAAFSFDFFHVEPVRVLHGRTLLVALAAYGVLGLLTAARGPVEADGP